MNKKHKKKRRLTGGSAAFGDDTTRRSCVPGECVSTAAGTRVPPLTTFISCVPPPGRWIAITLLLKGGLLDPILICLAAINIKFFVFIFRSLPFICKLLSYTTPEIVNEIKLVL